MPHSAGQFFSTMPHSTKQKRRILTKWSSDMPHSAGQFLALFRIALEHCPALCRIVLAKNCIALAKSTKVWSPATFLKILTGAMRHSAKQKFAIE
jgi:hypothetical protein